MTHAFRETPVVKTPVALPLLTMLVAATSAPPARAQFGAQNPPQPPPLQPNTPGGFNAQPAQVIRGGNRPGGMQPGGAGGGFGGGFPGGATRGNFPGGFPAPPGNGYFGGRYPGAPFDAPTAPTPPIPVMIGVDNFVYILIGNTLFVVTKGPKPELTGRLELTPTPPAMNAPGFPGAFGGQGGGYGGGGFGGGGLGGGGFGGF